MSRRATALAVELAPKRLELAHELVPTASVIAALINPTNRNTAEPQLRDLQAAAHTLGLQLRIVHASTERDFDTVFASLAQLRPGALVIGTDGFFISQSEQLASLAVRYAVPAVFENREFVAAGGLFPKLIVWLASTPRVFSKAKSLASCRFNSPQRSRCS
jgi:putative ABC transport system substrate-binding protein